MSNKLKNTARNQENQQSKRLNIQMLLEYATAAVMLAVCCFVPLYVSNGYYNIGEDKYAAFRQCMIWGMPVLCLLFIVHLIWNRKELQRPQMSATDIFVVLFLLAVCLSVVCGGFLPNALKGYPGWYMGLLSQVCFALIYLFASREGSFWRIVLLCMSLVATVVFVIAVCNRFNVDPLGFYVNLDQIYKEVFVSTLGQISWYASFWAVCMPIGIGLYIWGHHKLVRIVSVGYLVVILGTLHTVNAESAYLAFAAVMFVFLLLALDSAKTMLRWMIVCDLFLIVARAVSVCMKIWPGTYLHFDVITNFVRFQDTIMNCLLICALVLTGIVFGCMKKNRWITSAAKTIRRVLIVLVLIIIGGSIVLIVCNTKGLLPDALTQKLSRISYFVWNDDWGNHRGQTWSLSMRMYMEYPFWNKLFGVGPDCYYAYASRHYADRLYEMFGNQALTNAHNEWLNMLITTGLFGAISYIGIFVSAMKRFLQKENRNWFTIAVAGSIISYMAYNFFCYQQVLCTPFIFMLMGFGMYVVSHGKDASKTCN